MIKKTALALCTFVVASSASAKMNLVFNLAVDQENYSQSIDVESNVASCCQFGDLLLEVVAEQEVSQANIGLKIFRVTQQENILVAQPEFTTRMNQAAELTLEKDGQILQLSIVPTIVSEEQV